MTDLRVYRHAGGDRLTFVLEPRMFDPTDLLVTALCASIIDEVGVSSISAELPLISIEVPNQPGVERRLLRQLQHHFKWFGMPNLYPLVARWTHGEASIEAESIRMYQRGSELVVFIGSKLIGNDFDCQWLREVITARVRGVVKVASCERTLHITLAGAYPADMGDILSSIIMYLGLKAWPRIEPLFDYR